MVSYGVFALLLLSATAAVGDLAIPSDGLIRDEEIGQMYMTDLNTRMKSAKSVEAEAEWTYNTNISNGNQQAMVLTQARYFKFEKDAWVTTVRFNASMYKNATLKRMFQRFSILGVAALEEHKLKRLKTLEAEMTGTYSTSQVCVKGNCGLDLDPDLESIMANVIDDEDGAKQAWIAWRNAAGRPIKRKYMEWVKLSNEAAKANEFEDLGHLWLYPYESETFQDDIEALWKQLQPLYEQLHAYVRKKLKERFPNSMPADGTIPAHMLGNMWAQEWDGLLGFLKPYDKPTVDVTDSMKEKGWNVTKMYRTAEEFYTSLGLERMPDTFWTKSMLEKPDNLSVVCHASAWTFYKDSDFRIKQCTTITTEDLITIHHEMGHVEYFILYNNQPVIFQDGANPGFHEAIGDLMALSVSTPSHLYSIGLLDSKVDDNETDINFLLAIALQKIAFLPFGYLIDLWRWEVFSGKTTEEELNKKWWELRIKYQGVSPPVRRCAEDFDPGAKYHIPAAVPYIRYFVSHVVQFQFHKALCDKAGHKGPLYKCDIYNSKEAGDVMRRALSLGSSKPWVEAMKIITGQEKMDANPLREYFNLLENWLKKENVGETIGWKSAKVDTYFSSSSRTSEMLPILALCLLLTFIASHQGTL